MKSISPNFFYTAASFAVLGGLVSCQSRQKPLNIVYIMTDDHTSQMMSCYDTRYIETPNLDRIAKDGVRFTNSFVSNSLSGPSRACMLTGKFSHKNGFTDNTTCKFDGTQQTMPKLLQQAGYQTAIVGKWHLETLPTGFDFWEILPGQGDYYNPDFITQTNDTVNKRGYVTNIITDESLDWLQNKRDRSKPFCLFIHHKAIHRNWMADTCDLNLYEDKEFTYPENFFDTYDGRLAAASQEMSIAKDMDLIYDLKMQRSDKETPLKSLYEQFYGRMDSAQKAVWDKFYTPIIDKFYKDDLKGEDLVRWKYQRYMRDYAKTVKSLDDNVGKVLDYLEKEGLLDNTLVVYTSDQGFYMGEHGWFDKRFMYEESMLAPWGAVTTASVQFADKTVTALAFENPVTEGGVPAAGELNTLLTAHYAAYLDALNNQDTALISGCTEEYKAALAQGVVSDTHKANLYVMGTAECNPSAIKSTAADGTARVSCYVKLTYTYSDRESHEETPATAYRVYTFTWADGWKVSASADSTEEAYNAASVDALP